MMKNRAYLVEKCRRNPGIPMLVLLATLLMCPKVHAIEIDNQPNGKIITVSGYITCKGEMISDVLVDAVSTNEETISDREGKFTINVTKGGVITFQKEGYRTYEYMADEPQDNLIVCLAPVDEVDESVEQKETEKHEEREAVIIIQTKKELKKN